MHTHCLQRCRCQEMCRKRQTWKRIAAQFFRRNNHLLSKQRGKSRTTSKTRHKVNRLGIRVSQAGQESRIRPYNVKVKNRKHSTESPSVCFCYLRPYLKHFFTNCFMVRYIIFLASAFVHGVRSFTMSTPLDFKHQTVRLLVPRSWHEA